MKTFLSLLLCVFLTVPNALAVIDDGVSRRLSRALISSDIAVPGSAKQSVRGMSPSESDLGTGLENLYKMAGSAFGANIRQGLRIFLLIVICALILGIAGSAGYVEKPLLLVGVLMIAAICFGDMKGLFGLMSQTMNQIDGFSKTLLPALTAATAAAGAPLGAAARSAATVIFTDVLITVINRFIMPCAYAYLALVTADASVGGGALKGLADLIRTGASGLLKLLLTVFVAYLTVTGVISGTNDMILEKSAKLAISGMVPVVGGIVSEATQTIVAGAGILRNSIGIFGLTAVLGIAVVPLLRLGLNFILLKLAAAVSAVVAPAAVTKYINAVAQIYALMLGMTFSAAVMLLIGIVSCMQAGLGG